MKTTKYNKRAGKRTPVVRTIKTNSGDIIYIWKDLGSLKFLAPPYVFVRLADAQWPKFRSWLEKKAAK